MTDIRVESSLALSLTCCCTFELSSDGQRGIAREFTRRFAHDSAVRTTTLRKRAQRKHTSQIRLAWTRCISQLDRKVNCEWPACRTTSNLMAPIDPAHRGTTTARRETRCTTASLAGLTARRSGCLSPRLGMPRPERALHRPQTEARQASGRSQMCRNIQEANDRALLVIDACVQDARMFDRWGRSQPTCAWNTLGCHNRFGQSESSVCTPVALTYTRLPTALSSASSG